MNRLQWSDNTCSVGWTSVHGWFNADDLVWLYQLHPHGWITPTFYEHCLRGRTTREDILYWADERERPYYFNFPKDEKGKTLLVALKLRSMGDRE